MADKEELSEFKDDVISVLALYDTDRRMFLLQLTKLVEASRGAEVSCPECSMPSGKQVDGVCYECGGKGHVGRLQAIKTALWAFLIARHYSSIKEYELHNFMATQEDYKELTTKIK